MFPCLVFRDTNPASTDHEEWPKQNPRTIYEVVSAFKPVSPQALLSLKRWEMTSVKGHWPEWASSELPGTSLGAAEFTVGKKRTFISCDATPDLQIGIWLSLEVPTCCLEAVRMLYSSYPTMIPLFPQAILHFPPHRTSALLLQCHPELKGPSLCFLLETPAKTSSYVSSIPFCCC